MEPTLKIGEAARRVGCHPSTLLNYEKKGVISPLRDIYNHRRYKRADILKMQAVFSATWQTRQENKDETGP